MSTLRFTALVCCLAGTAAIAVCIFTDWNDALFLPLALALSAAGNLLNVLRIRKEGSGRKNGK